MNKMNSKKEKTMFSVEMCEDDSGMVVKAHGHQAAVVMMTAIGLAEYLGQGNAILSMDEFIPVLKKAYDDSEFLDRMVQALNLYADNKVDGIKEFAMLMAAAIVEEEMTDGKNKEED